MAGWGLTVDNIPCVGRERLRHHRQLPAVVGAADPVRRPHLVWLALAVWLRGGADAVELGRVATLRTAANALWAALAAGATAGGDNAKIYSKKGVRLAQKDASWLVYFCGNTAVKG